MITVGKLGTEPILESLDTIIGEWMEKELIVVDGSLVEVHLITGDGFVEIKMYDSKECSGIL